MKYPKLDNVIVKFSAFTGLAYNSAIDKSLEILVY